MLQWGWNIQTQARLIYAKSFMKTKQKFICFSTCSIMTERGGVMRDLTRILPISMGPVPQSWKDAIWFSSFSAVGKTRYFHGFQIDNIMVTSLTRMLTSQINGSAGRIHENYSFKAISVGQTKQSLNSDTIRRNLTICSTDWLVMIWAKLQYFHLAPTSTSR